MYGTLTKAEPAERLLLDQQARRLYQAWLVFIRYTRGDGLKEMTALFERRDVGKIMHTIDQGIFTALSPTWDAAANAVAADTANRVARQVGKASAQVGVVFRPGDPRAADLMRRQKLQFISGLTLQQRNATRTALQAGIRAGLGTEALARTFRDSIGLLPSQQQSLTAFERSMRFGRAEEMALPEAERGPMLSDAQIAQRVERQRTGLLQARAEVISRTEALQVVGTASDIALRESLRETGIEERKVMKEWVATNGGRTRDAHSARDGTIIPLDDAFAPGIYKPGDGGPRESISCRCVLRYHFED